jgi:hypothetical protein
MEGRFGPNCFYRCQQRSIPSGVLSDRAGHLILNANLIGRTTMTLGFGKTILLSYPQPWRWAAVLQNEVEPAACASALGTRSGVGFDQEPFLV